MAFPQSVYHARTQIWKKTFFADFWRKNTPFPTENVDFEAQSSTSFLSKMRFFFLI